MARCSNRDRLCVQITTEISAAAARQSACFGIRLEEDEGLRYRKVWPPLQVINQLGVNSPTVVERHSLPEPVRDGRRVHHAEAQTVRFEDARPHEIRTPPHRRSLIERDQE